MSDRIEWLRRKACPLCGRTDLTVAVNRVPDYANKLGEFDILSCPHCALGMTDPFPSERTVSLLYEGRDTRDFDQGNASLFDALKNYLARRDVVRSGVRATCKSVVDIGTGNGRFAIAAARAQPACEVTAVDFSDAPPGELAAAALPNLTYLPLARFGAMEKTYDLIFLRHVLEHVHDPVGFLRAAAARLAPGAHIAIEVPNFHSGNARVFGRKWDGHYMPRHLFHFSPSSLAQVVDRAGLQGRVTAAEMPKMGNTLQNILGSPEYRNWHRLAGVLLHPLQLGFELLHGSSSCLAILASKK